MNERFKPSSQTLALSGQRTIAQAMLTHAELSDALRAGGDVLVDCSQTDDVDISFFQLLWAARLSAEHNGVRVQITNKLPASLVATLIRGGFNAGSGFWAGEATAA